MAEKTSNSATLVKIGTDNGHTIVNKNSPLRRLNYFDGKFLRAPDLILEQQALLNQVRLSNQAGGAGVVHGYDCTLGDDDTLLISGGFGIDFTGRALLLNNEISVGIQELIEKSRMDNGDRTALQEKENEALRAGKAQHHSLTATSTAAFDECIVPPQSTAVNVAENNNLYLITINHSEAYCGEEDVFGKLCSEACSSSSQKSYIIEGIEVRAVPLSLSALLKQSAAVNLNQTHLRSRVASAYFAEEQDRIAAHISADGMSSSIWCLGAEAESGNGVAIALLARNGNNTLFLDAWAARRERMEAPARRYWAGRMAMRPWQIFLAQILQFQCQLRFCLTSIDADAPCKKITEFDPCAETRLAAREAAEGMRYLIDSLSESAKQLSQFNAASESLRSLEGFEGGFTRLEAQYQQLIDAARIVVPNRLLINCGIVEVPSAGYLPVNASSTVSVNKQIQRWFGEGVDLRFCVVRPDFVAHALEEAQHMDRICLLSGIDDAAKKPKVDVLVPNGEIQKLQLELEGKGYQADITLHSEAFAVGWPRQLLQNSKEAIQTSVTLQRTRKIAADMSALSGAARSETLETGGYGFYLAVQSGVKQRLGSSILAATEKASQSVLRLLDEQVPVMERAEAFARDASGVKGSALAPSSSLWVDLKTERDPFNLNSGETTDVRAKLTMVITRTVNNVQHLTIEERSINGQLHIQKSAAQKTDTQFTARLIADGIWKETSVSGKNTVDRSETVKFDEKLIVSRAGITGLPPTISIAVVNPSFFGGLEIIQLLFERVWVSPTESRVRMLLRYQGAGQQYIKGEAKVGRDFVVNKHSAESAAIEKQTIGREIMLAEGVLKADQSVLKADNIFHNASLSALNKIGKASSDSGFADRAGQLLFPPPQPVSQDLRILARESWVLFHRRRDKICEATVAEETLAKQRRYRVYHIHLDSQVNIDLLTAALETDTGAVVSGLKAKAVTIVDFSPGLATISTVHSDVRADWQAAVQVDADVHIALIAGEGDVINDGEALADLRLQSLTDILAPVSEAADDQVLLSVNAVPPTLAAAEVDGVIVFFTKAVATVCHSVYRLLTDDADTFIKRLQGYLNQPTGESTLAAFIKSFQGRNLSVNPRFESDSDKFFGINEAQQLAAGWDLLNDGPVARVISLSATETAPQQLITRQQSAKISQTVGTPVSADSVMHQTGPVNIFKSCPKVSVLIAEIECNDIYTFASFARSLEQASKQLTDFINIQGIDSELLKGTADEPSLFNPLFPVNFYRNSDRFEAGSRQRFLIKWQSELSGTAAMAIKGFYVVVARTEQNDSDTAENLRLAQAQGEALQKVMGINSIVVTAAANNHKAEFPVNCRFLTLLVTLAEKGPAGPSTNRVAVARDKGTVTPAPAGNGPAGPEASVIRPALNVDSASSVRFDENHQVIRDARFINILDRITIEDGNKVNNLELVSIDQTSDEAAEARAESLLKILKEKGVANSDAKVLVRKADAAESAEIIRSGFLLNRGIVLR